MKIHFSSVQDASKSGAGSIVVQFFSNYNGFADSKTRNKFLIRRLKDGGYLDILDALESIKGVIGHDTKKVIFYVAELPLATRIRLVMMASKHFFSLGFTYKTNSVSMSGGPVFVIIDAVRYKKLWIDIIHRCTCADLARSLASEPSNIVYPEEFCKRVMLMFKGVTGVTVTVYDEVKLKNMGFGLITGVGQGGQNKPRLLIVDYIPGGSGTKNNGTIMLVGKGVCFDSGGYNIKGNMSHMHTDKAGASVVVGCLHYFSKHAKKTMNNRLVAVVPLVENMVSENAIKQTDILKAYNGKTVEVTNTDAEGRLILADAIAYGCEHFKPKYIFDFATLTQWSSILHCDTSYVYYAGDDKISNLVEKYGSIVGERSIRMPMWPEYSRYTKSAIADYKNADYKCKYGSMAGSGFMAAMFILNFVPEELRKRWIHFDMTHDSNVNNSYLSNANGIYTCMQLIHHISSSGGVLGDGGDASRMVARGMT